MKIYLMDFQTYVSFYRHKPNILHGKVILTNYKLKYEEDIQEIQQKVEEIVLKTEFKSLSTPFLISMMSPDLR